MESTPLTNQVAGRSFHERMFRQAGRANDVRVALREQKDAAGFQLERFPAIPLQQATSIGHDVKLRKARRLRFVDDLPLQGKSAHILNFRAHPEQRSNHTERVERSSLSPGVRMFDPVGTGFAPREYSQFSVRTDCQSIE